MNAPPMPVPYQIVQRFPLNTRGRDFIVGDVHGAFTLLWIAMRQVHFDPNVDRLFIAGDLVDRGTESMRARACLGLSYVFAVKGNHEAAWLDVYEGGAPDQEIIEIVEQHRPMGADWWLKAKPEERDALVAMFAALPIAIEIETERGLVGIVHADVPRGMDWPTFAARLRAGDDRVIQTALWGRNRLQAGEEQGVAGIGRVFCGHTPQWGGAKRLGNVYALDTGAIFGLQGEVDGHLTIMNATAKTGAVLRSDIRQMVKAIDDAAEEGVGFGDYAQPMR